MLNFCHYAMSPSKATLAIKYMKMNKPITL